MPLTTIDSPGISPLSPGEQFAYSAVNPSSWFAAGLNALANIGTSIYETETAKEENRKRLEHEQKLQEEAWRREEQAFRRRVADFTAAGFSPLAALENVSMPTPPIVQTPLVDMSQVAMNAGNRLSNTMNNFSSLISQETQSNKALSLQEKDLNVKAHIEDMKNSTELSRIYYQNKQFYDKLARDTSNLQSQLQNARTLQDMKNSCDTAIAQLHDLNQLAIANIHDKLERDRMTENFNNLVYQLNHMSEEMQAQRDWQAQQRLYDHLWGLGENVLNFFEGAAMSFINPLGQARAGSKGFHPMDHSYGSSQGFRFPWEY